jgi:hypothetical protein
VLTTIVGFDENLGVGARFCACEENDLVLGAITTGAHALYAPEIAVLHPDKRFIRITLARAFAYGAGFGYVLRKHRYGAPAILKYLASPLASAYYLQTLRGRLAGLPRPPGPKLTADPC